MAVSLAPIPFSTFGSHEQSQMGQNYLRSLLPWASRASSSDLCGHLCCAHQSVAVSDDAIASIWGIVGYTVLLCFTLFKTSSIARSVLNAH